MAKPVQVGIRFPIDSWHAKQLQDLTAEAGLPITTVARDLLMAALEQTSSNPPPRPKPIHLEKFDANAPSWDHAIL